MGRRNEFDWKVAIGKYVFILFSKEDREIAFDLQIEVNRLINEPTAVQKFGDDIGLEFFWDQCLDNDKVSAFLKAVYQQHKSRIRKIILSKRKSRILVQYRRIPVRDTEVMPIILLIDDDEEGGGRKKGGG